MFLHMLKNIAWCVCVYICSTTISGISLATCIKLYFKHFWCNRFRSDSVDFTECSCIMNVHLNV